MVKRILCLFFRHQVLLKDLHRRKDGMVEWSCCRCGKILIGDCGLSILCYSAKCIGQININKNLI